jgi:hypothetical protein
MTLTADQQEVIRWLCPDGPEASGDQTPAQALNLAISSSWACEFDGIPIRPRGSGSRRAGGLMEWEPKPLEIKDGPIGAEEPTAAEIEAARRDWEQMDPETRAEIESIERTVELEVARVESGGRWIARKRRPPPIR